MALNPGQGGDTHSWNYSKPDRDGFSLSITGTVKAVQEVQAMNFGADQMPTTPKFWPNNNQPMMNIRIVLCGPSGGYRTLTFTPASKAAREGKKKSIHLDLYAIAGGQDMHGLIEKTITISTIAPPDGFAYGVGKPRPWTVQERTDIGPYELSEPLDPIFLVPQVFANTAVSGGAVQTPVSTGQPAPLPDSVNPMPGPVDPPAPSFPTGEDIPF